MIELFIPRRFSAGSERIIETANAIIEEYQAQGFSLTLRQLYYQFVARDLIPNKQSEYKRLGSIINDARLAGLIDWDAIEDRTRFLRSYETFSSPGEAARKVARNYIEDLWDSQPCYIEVWIEKDALVGVIEPVCGRWRLPYFACRGYSSQSEQYNAGKRLAEAAMRGQEAIVLHLGDHDPSGLDMTRDNQDRLSMFADGEEVQVLRLALNMDQIRRHRPPPNPAKETDSRIGGYLDQYGTASSWELDALDPKVIDQLIDREVRVHLDEERWADAAERERKNRERLLAAARDLD
jgi:hypothetical protein